MATTETALDISATTSIAQALDAVVGLAKLTARLAADRDRYRDALEVVVNCGEAGIARIAREALESRGAEATACALYGQDCGLPRQECLRRHPGAARAQNRLLERLGGINGEARDGSP